MSCTIKTVLRVLRQGGYDLVPSPLRVAGVDFGFDAALVGPNGYGNLVVVVAGETWDSAGAVKRLRSLILVLNRSQSSRPITVVLVDPIEPKAAEAVAQFAHTIRVPKACTPEAITHALAPLLPLRVPDPLKPTSVDDLFADGLGTLQTDGVSKALVGAARLGQVDVEETFLRLVSQAIEDRLREAE